jgi:hypothetical protein
MTILVEQLILLYGHFRQDRSMAVLEGSYQRYVVANKLESASASVNAVKSGFPCSSSLLTAVIYVDGSLESTLSLSVVVERQHGCEYGYSSWEHASLNIAVEWKHSSNTGTVLREYACSQS